MAGAKRQQPPAKREKRIERLQNIPSWIICNFLKKLSLMPLKGDCL